VTDGQTDGQREGRAIAYSAIRHMCYMLLRLAR